MRLSLLIASFVLLNFSVAQAKKTVRKPASEVVVFVPNQPNSSEGEGCPRIELTIDMPGPKGRILDVKVPYVSNPKIELSGNGRAAALISSGPEYLTTRVIQLTYQPEGKLRTLDYSEAGFESTCPDMSYTEKK